MIHSQTVTTQVRFTMRPSIFLSVVTLLFLLLAEGWWTVFEQLNSWYTGLTIPTHTTEGMSSWQW